MNIEVHTEIFDNCDEILADFESAVLRSLERCGSQAEGYAQDLCPENTSELKNSIVHVVIQGERAVYVGTNSEYGPYVELGTGKFVAGGRQTPWRYKDSEGNWHTTEGQPAQPFLKPAAADHVQTYRNIIKVEMGNG